MRWVLVMMIGLAAGSHHEASVFSPGELDLSLYGQPRWFLPATVYTVKVESSKRFTSFKISCNGSDGAGSFQILNDGLSSFSENSINTVVNRNDKAKSKLQLLWTAPARGCVSLIATVQVEDDWIYTKKDICVLKDKHETELSKKCCACDHAKYQVIFEGLWSSETHPKDFPTSLWLTHFSDVIGASHTSKFKLWQEGQTASYGFKQLAEFGVVRELETELRNASSQLRSIVKAAGLWHPNLNGNTTAVFRVDPKRHLLSLASMFGPSPDWIVGIDSLNLCQEDCSWIEDKFIDLFPYDAGTDNGITYMSVNSPSVPPEKIRRITTMYPEDPRSPFYNPEKKVMEPLARLYIFKEKVIPKHCSDLTESELIEQVLISENTEEKSREECKVTSYSSWSPCSVTCGKGLRMRTREYVSPKEAVIAKCDRQLVSKEMCVAELASCPGEEDEEEEIEKLNEPGECGVTKWSEWSDCSVTCGIGFILRTRTFVNDTIAVQKKCMHISTMEKEKCMLPQCKPQYQKISPLCKVTEWSNWSPCSVSCGSGLRTRIREFLSDNVPNYCSTTVSLTETHSCFFNVTCSPQLINRDICNLEPQQGPCRGTFRKWAYMSIKNMCVPFNYGGCRGNKNNFESEEECNAACRIPTADAASKTKEIIQNKTIVASKPINCVVSKWSEWSACKPCPVGVRNKSRTILVEPKYGGRSCPDLIKVIKCFIPHEFCNEKISITKR